jgi:phosphoribosylformylglycinamidine synthase
MTTVRVEVRLKRGVTDPEGTNTLKALNLLGFKEATAVRTAKVFEIDLGDVGRSQAENLAQEMCRKLLANPVIHDFRITSSP